MKRKTKRENKTLNSLTIMINAPFYTVLNLEMKQDSTQCCRDGIGEKENSNKKSK